MHLPPAQLSLWSRSRSFDPPTEFVYFGVLPGGVIKIGYTRHPELRERNLHMWIALLIEGSRVDERYYQQMFADELVPGEREIFYPSPHLFSFITAHAVSDDGEVWRLAKKEGPRCWWAQISPRPRVAELISGPSPRPNPVLEARFWIFLESPYDPMSIVRVEPRD